MNYSREQIYSHIYEFVSSNGVMSLAVWHKDIWICTVYYGVDNKMNLYIVTDPNSRHGLSIAKNHQVAFNIFDSHTKNSEPKKGVQGRGICEQVTNPIELASGLALWHKANPGMEERITLANLKKWKDTRLYKIKPTLVKFFNKELYSDQRFAEIELG